MKEKVWWICVLVILIAMPDVVSAQESSDGVAGSIKGLQAVLQQLYDEMIPMCNQLIGVGRAIAGFAALWYIAARVWRQLANAEQIDVYPLFKPFAIGICILLFPSVIGLINGVMQPTVSGTERMVTDSDAAIAALLKAKEEAVKKTDAWQMYVGTTGEGDRDRWYKYTHPSGAEDEGGEGIFEGIGNDIRFAMAKASYNFRNSVKEWMSEVLQVLFQAASLCINTMRTFNLIILAILGPLVFGLSVFDGFGHTLRHWIARYINVFLWLPVANIFGAVIGKIQENMLVIDLQQVSSAGDTFFSPTDLGYLIFMIIGIVGYFTVPSIAGHIMHVGGGGVLTGKVSGMAGAAAGAAVGGASGAIKTAAGGALDMAAPIIAGAPDRVKAGANHILNTPKYISEGYNEQSKGTGIGAIAGRSYDYLRKKLSGDQTGGKII